MSPERILRLYPRRWRDRYGAEFHQLLLDQLADGSAGRWWWLNPAVHAIRARLRGSSAGSPWPALLFAVSAVSIWSQLAVGWHWAPPGDTHTGLGMVLMSAGLLLAAAGAAPRLRAVAWRTRAGTTLLICSAALLGGALYVGHHWPGAVGHAWAGRDLIPAPLARVAWATTLAVSTYWVHPHALARLGSLQIGWMLASLLLLMAIGLSAARLPRRSAARRSPIAIGGMGLFVVGALCWSAWGAPGPRRLYASGSIDLVLVAAAAAALGITARARTA